MVMSIKMAMRGKAETEAGGHTVTAKPIKILMTKDFLFLRLVLLENPDLDPILVPPVSGPMEKIQENLQGQNQGHVHIPDHNRGPDPDQTPGLDHTPDPDQGLIRDPDQGPIQDLGQGHVPGQLHGQGHVPDLGQHP